MRKSRFSEEQIIAILGEQGPGGDIACRRLPAGGGGLSPVLDQLADAPQVEGEVRWDKRARRP